MNDQDIIRDLRSQLRAKDLKLEDLRHKKNQKIKQRQNTMNELKTRPLQEGFRKLAEENKKLRRRVERQEIELRRLRHENANWLKAFNHYQKEQN